MKILDLKVLKGPNYWSAVHHKLIVVSLDAAGFTVTHKQIASIHYTIKRLFPSLTNNTILQECIEPGMDNLKSLVCLLPKIALNLQAMAGISHISYTHINQNGLNSWQIIFEYNEPESGRYAAEATITLINALLNGENYDPDEDVQKIKNLWQHEKLGPSTLSIVDEAVKRGIPYIRLDNNSLVQLGYGKAQRRIEATITSNTNSIAVDLACNKRATKELLKNACVPVPEGTIVYNDLELQDAVKYIGYPLVMKPVDGNHGKGVFVNITNLKDAVDALECAKHYSKGVIVESFIEGSDFRALVINYKYEAAACRTPAMVTGDGLHNIAQLIEIENSNPMRGHSHDNMLTTITVDKVTTDILQHKGYTLDTILKQDEVLYLKDTANLSTGGTAEDVTDDVHPDNIKLFERIARIIGLDVCGIDIIAKDLKTPITENGGGIIEVNAAPGFRMHLAPTFGQPRNVAKAVIDMLFPKESKGRIPVIGITGTNGKTTTTRLVASMARQSGYTVGLTTTDGVFVGDDLIMKGDCSGPTSAQMILKDPKVDFAVLECARGGMLRAGLGVDQCDVAVITNVAEDHLGLNGIDTLEQLAKVKAIVAKSVDKDGYAILNADDDLVYAMKDELQCKIALYSVYPDSIRIQKHCADGGLAAVCEDGYLLLLNGSCIIPVETVENIPITFNGKAEFNIYNTLGATLAAYVSGISLKDIRNALHGFIPSEEVTPGRVNLLHFKKFSVLLDYAHNPHGIKAVGKLVKSLEATKRIGVIAGVGDRRNEDIMNMGEEAAKIFDDIIVRLDSDLRGRTADEMNELLRTGIWNVSPGKAICYFSDEVQAFDHAIHNAMPGSLVVFLTENKDEIYKRIQYYQENGINQFKLEMAV